jgi:Cu-Zn family superoxide dismutase
MSIPNWIFATALILSTSMFAQNTGESAHANIVNAQGQKIGTAIIREVDGGIRIDLRVSGLPSGIHGIHIHTVGKCAGPDFTSAGGHFNPTSKNMEKAILKVRMRETC